MGFWWLFAILDCGAYLTVNYAEIKDIVQNNLRIQFLELSVDFNRLSFDFLGL